MIPRVTPATANRERKPAPTRGRLVAALSMLAELPLPDEVKVAALRKLMRV